MTENTATNIKLRDEKMDLVNKIKMLMEKIELRQEVRVCFYAANPSVKSGDVASNY